VGFCSKITGIKNHAVFSVALTERGHSMGWSIGFSKVGKTPMNFYSSKRSNLIP
jgi:hypothetical protein